jgi:hypothetical protein
MEIILLPEKLSDGNSLDALVPNCLLIFSISSLSDF